MENKISVPRTGMKKSIDIRNLSENDYTYAFNVNLSEVDNDFVDASFEKSSILSTRFPEGYKVVGRVNRLKNNSTYFFLSNYDTGNSLFGVVDNKTVFDDSELESGLLEEIEQEPYKEFNILIDDICSDEKFNFSELHPIQNIVIKEEKTGGVVYFTDFINPSRYIELDNLDKYFEQDVACDDPISITCPDISKMRIHKLYELPEITDVRVSSGGSLPKGTYSFLVALSDAMGNEISEYTSITQPISIWDSTENTDKAIRLTVDNIDQSYTHFKVVMIYNQHLDNVQTYRNVGVFSSNNKEVIVSSVGSLSNISYEDLIYVNTRVTNSENLTSFNNSLAEYGLVFERELNLQPVVNLLGSYLEWQTHIGEEDLYSYPDMSVKYVGYNRNEVVPFSIRFLKKGGSYTALFPLVGREANPKDLEIIQNEDVESLANDKACSDSLRVERWKLYDTSTKKDGCGVPDEYIEVEDIFDWTCTDNDTNRTGPGHIEIDTDYVFTTLEEYYKDKGCFNNLCTELNKDLSSEVDCDESPCNNNPTVVESRNFISEEVGVKKTPIYGGSGVMFEYMDESHPEYQLSPPRNIQKSSVYKTLNSEPFYNRDIGNLGSNPVNLQIFNMPQIVRGTKPYTYRGTVMANIDNVTHESSPFFYPIYYTPDVKYYRNSSGVGSTEVRYGSRGSSGQVVHAVSYLCPLEEEPQNLKCFFTTKNSNPDPMLDELFNYEDMRIHFHFEYASNLYPDNSIGSMYLDDLKDKVVKVYYDKSGAYIKPGTSLEVGMTPVVEVYNRMGTLLNTFRANPQEMDFSEIKPKLHIICEMGTIEVDDPNIDFVSLSPRGEFFFYLEDLEPIGYRIDYDDIVIGTSVSYTDTCIVRQPVVKACEAVPYIKGDFSYHESDIRYPDNRELFDSTKLKITPNDIPQKYRSTFAQKFTTGIDNGVYKIKDSFNLACKPIRHFKFPSNQTAPFMQEGSNSQFSNAYIYPLGVTIDENIINVFLDIAKNSGLITEEERNDIHGYEIFRGDLSITRSIKASGLTFDTRSYKEKGREVQYLNYPYNSYGPDELNPSSGEKQGFGNVGNVFGFHSPETDYFNLNSGNEIRVEGYQFGYSKGFFDEVEKHPKMVILSSKAYDLASSLASLEVAMTLLRQTVESITGLESIWGTVGTGSTGTNAVGVGVKGGLIAAELVLIIANGLTFDYGRYKLQWQETFKNLGQPKNFANYYFSEGNYNHLKVLQNEGNYLRGIRINKKVRDGRFVLTDSVDRDKVEFNNIDREYTTLLKVSDIEYPSGYTNYDKTSLTYAGKEGIRTEGRSEQVVKPIASPYIQIVDYNPTQHGQINDIKWLYTGYRGDLKNPSDGCTPIFGGDTFIVRHTLKRKLPLFLTTAMGQADMTPFDYKVYNNIGKDPKFYISYDATSEFDEKGKIFPEVISDYSLDTKTENKNYITPPSKIYLYYYGVPSFLTESRINTSYREFGREPGDNFYPNVGDLGRWTQESNVSIRTPNFFKYYQTYSNQVNSFNLRTLSNTYKEKFQEVAERAVNGVIFSLPDVNENGQTDPWLKFRPLDFFEFETKYGKLKELKGIENEAIMARFEDTAIIYNKVSSTIDDGSNTTGRLGGKDIFQRRTVSFVNSELGFGGSKQAESLSCEFGHFYVDTERGQILQIPPGGGNMVDISSTNGKSPTFMQDWFKRNIPFKILKSNIEGIENLDVDNNYNGIGISLGYDSLHKRLLITKKDYLPIVDCISYSRDIGFYTTCGTDERKSCPPGYTYNPENDTCEKYSETEACPPGYTYDPISGTCTRPCSARFAFMIDNHTPLSTTLGKDYIRTVLQTLPNDSLVSIYTWWGSDYIVGEDLDINTALNLLNNVQDDSYVYSPGDSICSAMQWLGTDPDITRILHGYYYCPDVPAVNCTGQSFIAYVDSYKATGVINIGAGDCTGLENGGYFSEDGFEITTTPPQRFLDIYEDAYCDGTIEVPTICDCQIEEDKCICINTVPPIINNSSKVELYDKTKFREVSWTVAYSLRDGSFNSFMGYFPNYYINMQGYFESGYNEETVFTESNGVTNKSYGVFKGEKQPMEIEIISKGNMKGYAGGVELLTEAKKYYNEEDYWVNPDLTFNKSIIYNRRECSGELHLELAKGRLTKYPKSGNGYQIIPITKTESTFNYNYFFDRVDHSKDTPFIVNDENQIRISLNNINFKQRSPLPRINGDYFLNRLTFDQNSRYNMTVKLHKMLTNLDNL